MPILLNSPIHERSNEDEDDEKYSKDSGQESNEWRVGRTDFGAYGSMDSQEFRRRGKEMIDFIADYLRDIGERRVLPDVEPGYMKEMMPLTAPFHSEPWDNVLKDINNIIMPGLTHWQHPRFHAYFPAGNTFPSILGDLLQAGLGVNGFSWASSPAITELETIMMQWLGSAIGLPSSFLPFPKNERHRTMRPKDSQSSLASLLNETDTESSVSTDSESVNNSSLSSSCFEKDDILKKKNETFIENKQTMKEDVNNKRNSKNNHGGGGGVILGSASECILIAMITARHNLLLDMASRVENDEKYLQRLQRNSRRCQTPSSLPPMSDDIIKKKINPVVSELVEQKLSSLVAYTSLYAHSCVEKAAMICRVKIRQLNVGLDYSLDGQTLRKQIQLDRRNGMIPFFISATLGTTTCCSFDDLISIGEVSENERLWLHVDAAYAGSAFICPEYRYLMRGIERAQSFNMNPNKWLLCNFDISCIWVRNHYSLTSALSVDPIYLRHEQTHKVIDLRHWGIALSRRFRSLKLWFVFRTYGINGLRRYIREHVRLARLFAQQLRKDQRFYIVAPVKLGLVCFRFHDNNEKSQQLLFRLNDSALLHMIPAMIDDGKYMIRFCVCAPNAVDSDIDFAVNVIRQIGDQLDAEDRMMIDEKLKFNNNLNESKKQQQQQQQHQEEEVGYKKRTITNSNRKKGYLVRMISDPKYPNENYNRSTDNTIDENEQLEDGQMTNQTENVNRRFKSFSFNHRKKNGYTCSHCQKKFDIRKKFDIKSNETNQQELKQSSQYMILKDEKPPYERLISSPTTTSFTTTTTITNQSNIIDSNPSIPPTTHPLSSVHVSPMVTTTTISNSSITPTNNATGQNVNLNKSKKKSKKGSYLSRKTSIIMSNE
ncbi:hypothetical protein SNEBB_006630 [Seison nebaliae]|nr:hypothetical protein SNEBB_006630 [Seison nebaliae]